MPVMCLLVYKLKKSVMLKNKAMKTRILKINQIILSVLFVVFLLTGRMLVTGAERTVAADIERAAETKLVVEDWMVSEKYWDINSSPVTIETEAEPVYGIESWMLDESRWDVKPVKRLVVASDEELKIEEWMINKNLWN